MSDIKRKSVVVGITGGIACGKSEVGRILEGMGYVLSDTDHVAHGLMVRGTPVYRSVVDFFGEGILLDDGEISRLALGRIVFDDPSQREKLNRLVHPAVRDAISRWIAERRSNGENAAVQIPLLFESGMGDLDFDGIICVSSSDALMIERLEKRGMNHDEAMKRIRSQMPLLEKEQLSDCVIRNLGTLQELKEATRRAMESLLVER